MIGDFSTVLEEKKQLIYLKLHGTVLLIRCFNNSVEIDERLMITGFIGKCLLSKTTELENIVTFKYRIPPDLGSSDGTGNYSYELSRESIFESAGIRHGFRCWYRSK